jgi:hydrogenase-4 component B
VTVPAFATGNVVGSSLLAAVAAAVLAVVVAVLAPARVRSAAVGVLTAAVGLAGVAGGSAAMAGVGFGAELPWLLPLAGVSVRVDGLGGLFIAVSGAVVALAAVYGIAVGVFLSPRRSLRRRWCWCLLRPACRRFSSCGS